MPQVFNRSKAVAGLGDMGEDGTFPFSLIAAATTNLTVVKNAPGVIVSIHAIGQTAALRYLKFYDSPVKPVAGQGVPVRRYTIPGSTTGAGFILQPALPMMFFNGISFALMAGTGLDSDSTNCAANDVILTLEYI